MNVEKQMEENAKTLCDQMVIMYNTIPKEVIGDLFVLGTTGLFRRVKPGQGPIYLNRDFASSLSSALLAWFHVEKHCLSRFGNNVTKTFVLPIYCPSCCSFHLYFAGGLLLSGNTYTSLTELDVDEHVGMVASGDHADTLRASYGNHPYWKMLESFADHIEWISQGGASRPFSIKRRRAVESDPVFTIEMIEQPIVFYSWTIEVFSSFVETNEMEVKMKQADEVEVQNVFQADEVEVQDDVEEEDEVEQTNGFEKVHESNELNVNQVEHVQHEKTVEYVQQEEEEDESFGLALEDISLNNVFMVPTVIPARPVRQQMPAPVVHLPNLFEEVTEPGTYGTLQQDVNDMPMFSFVDPWNDAFSHDDAAQNWTFNQQSFAEEMDGF